MKRIISLVLLVALCLMMTSAALAEPFSLHCGMTFEMSKEEIIQKIQKAGYKPEEVNYEKEISYTSSKTYIRYEANIGNRHAIVTVHFIENSYTGEVIPSVVHYSFNPYAGEKEIDKLGYQTMEAALQGKYGAPDYRENTGRMFPYTNSALGSSGYHTGMLSVDSATCTIGESTRKGYRYIMSCPNYSQWIVSDGASGYVGISHTFSNITKTDLLKKYVESSEYFEHVSYSHMNKGSYEYLLNKQKKSFDGI